MKVNHLFFRVCAAALLLAVATARAGTLLTDTNGLTLWLDASAASTMTLSGSTVTQWRDKQGSAAKATTYSGTPTLMAAGINGLPSVHFDTSSWMNDDVDHSAGPVTIFYVARETGGANGRVLSAAGNNWLMGFHGGERNRFYFEGWVYGQDTVVAADTAPHLFAATIGGAGQNSTVYAEGVELASNQKGTQGPNNLMLNGAPFGEQSDCDFAEVLVYNRALSPSELHRVGYYLTTKYGLTTSYQGAARIVEFGIPGSRAVIDQTAKTITWTVPYSTNLATLAPSIYVTSGTCNPPGGTVPSPNFSAGPVTYTVTDGGTTNVYTATAVHAPPSTACEITAFNANLAGSRVAVQTTGTNTGTVVVSVPAGTTNAQLAALTPTLTLSPGATCVIPTPPLSLSAPVHYLVTAEDGVTTKNYTATVVTNAAAFRLFVVKTATNGLAASDFDYLTVVPASRHRNNGVPAVFAVASTNDFTSNIYLQDYLRRYRPTGIDTVNFSATISNYTSTAINAAGPLELSVYMATNFWATSSRVVLVGDAVTTNNYPNVLQASALAAALNAPMLYYNSGKETLVQNAITQLGATEVVYVNAAGTKPAMASLVLTNPATVVTYLAGKGITVDYFAVANPTDLNLVTCAKLSLTAPFVAARRTGIVVPEMSWACETNAFHYTGYPAIKAELGQLYTAIGRYPSYLALVGNAHSIPLSYRGPNEDPGQYYGSPADLDYADVDADVFPDLAIGRIMAYDIFDATLLTSRISTYEQLFDGAWEKTMVDVGGQWNSAYQDALGANYGFSSVNLIQNLGPTQPVEAAIIGHNDHSSQHTLGNAFDTSSVNVLAPTAIFSEGCATAAIDIDVANLLVVNQLFKLGAVSFVGSTRSDLGVGKLKQSAAVNALLAGQPLGRCYLAGVDVMSWNGADDQRWNWIFLGDPGLKIHVPSAPVVPPANHVVTPESSDTAILTVNIPSTVFAAEVDPTWCSHWGLTYPEYWGEKAGLYGMDVDRFYLIRQTITRPVVGVEELDVWTNLNIWVQGNVKMGMMAQPTIDYQPDGTAQLVWAIRANVMDWPSSQSPVPLATMTNDTFRITYDMVPDITAFNPNLAGSSATIQSLSDTNGTVTVYVPTSTTDAQIAALAPTYTLDFGATCNQANNAVPTPPLSTGTPVAYVVSPDAGSSQPAKVYSVTVVRSPFAYAAWTGDADSGISNTFPYTVAVNLAGSAVTVNGVTFEAQPQDYPWSGANYTIEGSASGFSGASPNLTGNSFTLGGDFLYDNPPCTVTLLNLTEGKAYETTFFSFGWGDGVRPESFVSGGDSRVMDQNVYGSGNGIRILYRFVATSSTKVITISPSGGDSFHFCALANREAMLSQSITFGPLSARTYGDASFALTATASSGLPVSYASSDTNVASVAGSLVTIRKAGTATLTASQAGNTTYTAATNVQQTLTVNPRPVLLSGTRVYDGTTAAAVAGLSVTNKVGTDDLALSGSVALAGKDVGPQAVSNVLSFATPARVQSATNSTGSSAATSFVVTLGAAPTNGNTLVAVIATRGTSSNRVSSIAQTGATWTRAAEGANTSGTTTEIWYAPNVSGAGTSITINQASLVSAAVVMEYSGLLAASPLDQTANARGSGTSAVTGTTPPTTQAAELWIGGIGIADGRRTLNGPYGSSFTVVASPKSGSAGTDAMAYALEKIVSATGAASSGGTVSTSDAWSGAIATFKAATTVSLSLGGTAAANYTLTGMSGTMTVTAKELTLTGATTASNKVYDATAVATLGGGALQTAEAPGTGTTSDGKPYTGDTVGVALSGTFDTKDAGIGKSVTSTSTLTGAQAGNYSLTQPAGLTADITPKALSVTGAAIAGRPYDGATNATFSAGSLLASEDPGSGTTVDGAPYTGDAVTLNLSGFFASKDKGVGIAVTSASTLSGAQSGNYTLTQPTGLTGEITARALAITAGNQSKTFGETLAFGSGSTNFLASGLQAGETVGTVTLSCDGGGAGAAVGTYPITPSAATGGTFTPGNYAITYNDGTLTVNRMAQTITFGPLTDRTYGDAPFSLTATASSGLPVSFASSDTNVATVASNVVTILKGGTTTITATQPGDADYEPAAPVPQLLTINPASQTISFDPLAEKTYGDAPFSLTATASSGLPVSYASSDTNVATVAGSLVTVLNAGFTTLTASQAGNENYAAATPVPQTLTVAKATPVISWAAPAAIGYGTPLGSQQLNATSGGVAGSFVYTPPAGTVLPPRSTQTLSVQFTPTDTANYSTPAPVEVQISVAATALEEDFEDDWADNALVNTANGWVSGAADRSTVSNLVTGYTNPTGYNLFPLLYNHRVNNRVLRLATEGETLRVPFAALAFTNGPAYLDLMANLNVFEDLPAGLSAQYPNLKGSVFLVAQGAATNLAVYHGTKDAGGFGAPAFTTFTNAVAPGTWRRLTVAFDATADNGGAEAFRVLLDGKALVSADAYGDGWKTRVFGTPCTPDGGTWFLSAARYPGSTATNLASLSTLAFKGGGGLFDDLVATLDRPNTSVGTLLMLAWCGPWKGVERSSLVH